MKGPQTLQQAIQFFSEHENCRQFMIAVRWPDGKVRCPILRLRESYLSRKGAVISLLREASQAEILSQDRHCIRGLPDSFREVAARCMAAGQLQERHQLL